jgi:diguanylate cyclase (GGDEF)-like protein/PAS domain S-box-containing protein
MLIQSDPYKLAVDTTAIVVETDLSGAITYVNERFCALSGYTADELMGQNHRILKSGAHSREFYSEMWNTLTTEGIWHGELCNRRKDGSLYWVSSTMVALTCSTTGLVNGYAAIRFDVTERYELLAKLKKLTHCDALTGLPNRAALQVCFEKLNAVTSAGDSPTHALCVVDIDNFSFINKEHGYPVGDSLLRYIGLRINDYLVDSLAQVFHWGGDEFIILLKDRSEQDNLLAWVGRLIDHLAHPIPLHGGMVQVTCCAGASEFGGGEKVSPDLLLRQSNLALYKAKALGPKRVVCYGLDEFAQDRQNDRLQRELRHAILSNELRVYYQPKLDLRTGRVTGAEALLRWLHPISGMVPPLDFLPRIENLPVALEVDQWVLEQALGFLQTHFSDSSSFSVSVNISARQFQSRDFPQRLKDILHKYPKVAQHQLELEILESTAIEDFLQVNLNISAVKALGVNVALDDFGVGYSSLAYLKRISPQTIKIDKTFILGILDNEDDLILTQSIINLSSSFHFGVVAEGVETVEHEMLLARLGCAVVQGYGVLKPVASDEFLKWYADHNAGDFGAWQWRKNWNLNHRYLLAAKLAYEHIQEKGFCVDTLKHRDREVLQLLELWAQVIGISEFGSEPEFQVLMRMHRLFVAALDASKDHPHKDLHQPGSPESLVCIASEIVERVQALIQRAIWLPARGSAAMQAA